MSMFFHSIRRLTPEDIRTLLIILAGSVIGVLAAGAFLFWIIAYVHRLGWIALLLASVLGAVIFSTVIWEAVRLFLSRK